MDACLVIERQKLTLVTSKVTLYEFGGIYRIQNRELVILISGS